MKFTKQNLNKNGNGAKRAEPLKRVETVEPNSHKRG